MNSRTIPWAVVTALALAGCGSGGGDEGASSGQSVAISGAAAKGLIANGTVTVTEVSGTELGRTVTDASGRFNLRVSLPAGRPFIIKVAGGNGATHLDEVTGTAQPLPASFDIRAGFTQPPASTLGVSVTPFSEMAVAAAEKAPGGLTADNIQAGNSTVAQILGFQPTTVDIKPTSATGASADEQKLALLLTAVSQMAASGAAGCTSGTPGERAACVVDKLAAATTTNSLQLGNNLSTAVVSAIDAVLQEPRLAGNVSSAVLGAILQNLGCTGSACNPEQAPPVAPNPVPAAIASAKALLTDIKSDWQALFVSGTTSGVGDLRTQADKFRAATHQVQAPVEMTAKTVGVMTMAIDLYNDYRAGRTSQPFRSHGEDLVTTEGFWPYTKPFAYGCTLFQNSGLTTQATAPSNANYIGCSVRYHAVYNFQANNWVEYSHFLPINPTATAGHFDYSMRARSRTCSFSGCNNSTSVFLSAARFGTIDATTSNGAVTSMTVAGDAAPPFRFDSTALVGDHTTLSLSGSRVVSTSSATTTVSGSVTVQDSANATLGTLTIGTSTLNEVAAAGGHFEPWGGTLDVNWVTPTNGFAGSIAATEPVRSKDQSLYMPTKVVISGKLSNTENGVNTEFITGALTLTARGVADYDASRATSATNFFTVDGTLAGSLTAPNRPRLELTLATGQKTSDDKPSAATLQYRSVVGETPRTTVAINVTTDSAGVPTFSLNETAKGLSLAARKGATTANLLLNGSTVIGTLNLNTGVLTFSDGTFMSVEIAQ